MWKRGDLVELNGELAVVVGVDGESGVPEDHVGLWYGESKSISQSGGRKVPVIWTVPKEYCQPALPAEVRH
jgi:hypothetical protein